MKLFGFVLTTLFLFGLTASYAQDKKDDKKDPETKTKLVGVWEAKDGNKMEFFKDGKLKITIKFQEKERSVNGTYTLEGNKVTFAVKEGDMEFKDAFTIKSVDDKKLVIVDNKGVVDELMKKK